MPQGGEHRHHGTETGSRFQLTTSAKHSRPPATDRARKLSLFVDAFFTKFPTFQNPPFHPKWKEVSLSAPLADWQRLPAAKQWLEQHGIQPVARNKFDEFLQQTPAAAKLQSPIEKEALFRQFQAWEAEKNAAAAAPPPRPARQAQQPVPPPLPQR